MLNNELKRNHVNDNLDLNDESAANDTSGMQLKMCSEVNLKSSTFMWGGRSGI